MSIVQEFREFAIKGNMVDMAVGIIIGGAFGKIVSSLVSDVLMPPLGLLMGGVDFADKAILLKAEVGEAPAVTLNYGLFINAAIDFLIVAVAVFMLVKAINRLRRKQEVAPPPPAEPSAEVVLLTEIRDALKAR